MQLEFPNFSNIDLDKFASSLEALFSKNLEAISSLLAQKNQSWDTLMLPLEAMDDAVERLWSPLSHLHSVMNSGKLREVYQACLPLFSAYEAKILQNKALYEALLSLKNMSLDDIQTHILNDQLQSFELSGVALPEEKKQRFEAIQTELSKLSNQYENNVLDATQAYSQHFSDDKRLSGLPTHALASAEALATSKGESGYRLTIEFPHYIAVMTYAEDRALRQSFYEAYVTRASDVGPNPNKFDNGPVMTKILALRDEKAKLLGFDSYATLSLATKMADSKDVVLHFLNDLVDRAHPQAKYEMAELESFAKSQGLDELKPWDTSYYAEKLRQRDYEYNEEELRPYFTTPKVMDGLFAIIQKLYKTTFHPVTGADTWHSDVMVYALKNSQNETQGLLYVDLYARENKRGGAWMDSCQSRRRLSKDTIQMPIAFLTCNFAKPTGGKPGQLSHDEVQTLFHEMGHCLHHLLTQVDYHAASGINGVEWDAVELPSQFFEHWAWDYEAIQLITSHIDTKEVLPKSLFDKLLKAKNFQSAMGMMRQLEFSLFDFTLHLSTNKTQDVMEILNTIRQRTALMPAMPYNRFPCSFSHIFAGGYAAGYYSYKWAEVLSSDAFSKFEEAGIFDEKTGRAFLENILAVGGSKPAKDAFIAFRGREPDISALLRHNGIAETA